MLRKTHERQPPLSGLENIAVLKRTSVHERREGVTLRSPAGAPCEFVVEIVLERGALAFQITGEDPETSGLKTQSYRLTKTEHTHYLDLLAGVARDFHIRVPVNRRPQIAPARGVEYTPLLTENLSPKILYGYGDPAALRVDGQDIGDTGAWYYVVSTSNDAPDSFPIIRSRDLRAWEPRGFIFPRGQQPAWAAVGENVADYWAPEVHKVDGEFRAYFVARDKHTRELCIGVAKSRHPEGPYAAESEPLLKGDRIDPHVFVDNDAAAYLYWKEDNNAIWPNLLNELLAESAASINLIFEDDESRRTASFLATLWPWTRGLEPMERFFVQQLLIEAVIANFADFEARLRSLARSEPDQTMRMQIEAILRFLKTPVYAQPLSPDGLRLVGEPRRVLENDQVWEAHLVEGMWVTRHADTYYMFYAGNDFSTPGYGIGVAAGESPLGPFRKTAEPLLGSTAHWSAPGHPSFAIGPGGENTLFLHGYFPGAAGYKQFRALLSVVLDFKHGLPAPRSA